MNAAAHASPPPLPAAARALSRSQELPCGRPRPYQHLFDAIEDAADVLLEHPDAGRALELAAPAAARLRAWVLRDSGNWLLVCRADPGITIVRLLHGAHGLAVLFADDLRPGPRPYQP